MQKKDKSQTVALVFNELPEDEDKLLVLGNEELLFTAFRNIVSNACKYSADSHATVILRFSGQSCMVDIIDKGIGIAENELKNIFQPFYRVGEPRSIGGFGLGLSLAYRIIKLHKGTIKVTSRVGEGSTFTIELPLAR